MIRPLTDLGSFGYQSPPMKTAKLETRCECQSRLTAVVDEQGRVTHGQVRMGRGDIENAPATSMNAGAEQLHVGWLCPFCGRNTLRSFDRGGLVFVETGALRGNASAATS